MSARLELAIMELQDRAKRLERLLFNLVQSTTMDPKVRAELMAELEAAPRPLQPADGG